MSEVDLSEATTAWVGARGIDSLSPDARRRLELQGHALRQLAGGRPVSSQALAAVSERPHEEIAEFMSQARKGGPSSMGMEIW
jgi:hypothetical protein